jgi:RNA polymerase sigma-70 factor (ECF subfamily)
MTRLASRLVGEDAAPDVVQEALTRAWRRRATYDPDRGEPLPWLLAITADRARRHRTRSRPPVLHPVPSGSTTDPDRTVDIAAAVARLPHKQRLAVELHYFLDLDTATTAAALGCAVGTVKSQLSDARKQLRSALGDM